MSRDERMGNDWEGEARRGDVRNLGDVIEARRQYRRL